VSKKFGNVEEDIGFFHANASVVDAWRVDEHDGLPANMCLNGANLAGT